MANKKSSKSKASTKQSVVTTAPAEQNSKHLSLAVLKKWNLALAVVLAVQAVVILIISKTVTLPVTTHYLVPDTLASQAANHTVLALAVRHLFDINLAYLVGGFLLISAAFHAALATRERSHYEADLKQGINGLRWLDYGITASIMLMAIALLNGVYDASTLAAIIVLIALLHLLGFFGETNAVTLKAKWQSFVGLLAAGGAVWLIIGLYLKDAIVYGSGLPHSIYWIDSVIFVMTLGLAANTLMIFKAKGKWSDYLYGERVYMILSLAAKTSLAWLIFAGFLKK